MPDQPNLPDGFDDLRAVIDRACEAVAKGDSPEAISAYIWSNVAPQMSAIRAAAVEEERERWVEMLKATAKQCDEAAREVEELRDQLVEARSDLAALDSDSEEESDG